ncbi:2962_t:CDS:2, partial [Paraglomus occultum]
IELEKSRNELEVENRKTEQKRFELQVEQEKTRRMILEQEREREKVPPDEVSTYLNTIDKPEPNQGETKMQNWFNDLVDILNETWKVSAVDTHNNPYLSGLKPDISIFDPQKISDGASIPMFVRTVLELKQRKSETSNFGNEDKGQLIDYIQILDHYEYGQYSEYSTTFTEGIRLFFNILDIESVLLDLNMPNVNPAGVILRRFLGQGSSGLVDVWPSNIMYMMDSQGNVMLIDWGSAIKLTTGLPSLVDYEGTITYASPAILANNLERHIPQISDDLHSFVHTMFKLLHPTFKLGIIKTARSIEDFWNKAFNSVFWNDMVKAADRLRCQYDDLKQ